MRRFALIILTVLIGTESYCQFQSSNYVKTTVFGDETASLTNAAVAKTFYDGLGKPRQSVSCCAGGDGEDITTRIDYDRRGNKSKEWLPVPSSLRDGAYLPDNAFQSCASDFYGLDEIPYTHFEYEEWSGTNRLTSQCGPGRLWQKHAVRHEYLSNDDSGILSCPLLKVKGDGSLQGDGNYRKGTLRIKKTVDEDGLATLEFSDRNGRTILSRTVSADGSTLADTRYIYDRRGDLRYVISPEGMAQINEAEPAVELLHRYANSYTYDIWHRIVEKRIAGQDPVMYVYDRLNRPVMSQSGEQRKKGQWTLTKYDRWNRPVVEGIATVTSGREELQKLYGDSIMTERLTMDEANVEILLYYSSDSGPRNFSPYKAWYYDDYTFTKGHTFDNIPGFAVDKSLPTKGLCTGTAYIHNHTAWFVAVRYDHRRLPVWKCFYDIYLQDSRVTECVEYDFRGNVSRRYERVEDMAEQTVIDSRDAIWAYTLDRADRITSISLSVNGCAPFEIQHNNYDAVGRLVGSTAGVTTEFAYNVRSDIVEISSPQFLQRLYYAENPYNPTKVSFNGSPCASFEAHRDEELIVKQEFVYSYDPLGRLNETGFADGRLFEAVEFDLNANPIWVMRKSADTAVQDAVIEYDGNKAVAVHDNSSDSFYGAAPSFPAGDYSRTFDSDGRLASDETRSIVRIDYFPWLNLPQYVKLEGGAMYNNYTPDGLLTDRTVRWRTVSTVAAVSNNAGTPEKQAKADNISSITHHYRGSFEAVERNWKLHTETGFYDLNERKHYFYVKDRLGSTVAVVDDAGRTRQLTAYYPSGVPYDLFGFQRKTDRLHIGNRWLEAAGLFSYDNTARFHYPLIPSFDTPDPLAEKYPQFSPYAHCAGNPLRYVDRDGKKVRFAANASNEFKNHFSTAIRILNHHGVGGIFKALESRKEIITIAEGDKNSFSPKNRTIIWNPKEGMITDNLSFLSPTTFLNHEGAHALRFLEDPKGIIRDQETTVANYGNLEEKRVIQGIEQQTAEALGEVKKGEPTRNNHFGTKMEVSGPDSNINKNEIIIQPKSLKQ